MDFGGRNLRKSPSSDRFLSVFSPPTDSSVVNDSKSGSIVDELNEDDVFWMGDFAENMSSAAAKSQSEGFSSRMFQSRSSLAKREEKFGILAALSDDSKLQTLRRNPSFSAAKNVLAIPKPPEVAPAQRYNFSAPVNVPLLSKEMIKANGRRSKAFFDVPDDDSGDEGLEDTMLPPHEIVARGSALTPNTTFSMLEGAGRTLKGRDLRQVRNAVFRQTGFLD